MKKGFTLIELLVVIGVMAVIAAGVIATINPQQKVLQARDAQGQSGVGQIAGALQSAAAVSDPFAYPATLNALVTGGELAALPAAPAGAAGGWQSSGLGTAGPVCVWVAMQAARNLAGGNTVWCWCSNLGSASLRPSCP